MTTINRAKFLALPTVAMGLAIGLLWPQAAPAYVLLGGPLSLDLRAVRVFDNFSDPEAHSNTAEHPSFPGFSGPELAIWKAAVEWGSVPHGDGNGDPHQPGGLGSGGANFDFAWQGRTDSIGGPDDNVVSQIGGASLGVLAFTELPADDGWRIRFRNVPWTWHDDPGSNYPMVGTSADIQAVATHEFGHALGLDHSAVAGATMSGQIPFPNIPLRSIEDDDIQGVQFLYGARDPQKPWIRSYRQLGGGLVEIYGQNFAALENEVWFTPEQATRVGVPVALRGVRATHGGRRLTVLVPSDAGPGDILVRRPGNSFANLSNAFPFDPSGNPCFVPSSYGVGKQTSVGSPATLVASGSTSFSDQSLTFSVFGLPLQTTGVLLFSHSRADLPFFGGSLLVEPPIQRGPRFTTDFGFALIPYTFDASLIDDVRFAQAWFLDPGDSFGVGTTNGLRVTFCP